MNDTSNTANTSGDERPPLRLFEGIEDFPDRWDTELRELRREDILDLAPAVRLRWFYLLRAMHLELERVTNDLLELLGPNNDNKIITLMGMSGIGKTTLVHSIVRALWDLYKDRTAAHEKPFLYVTAPANGDRSLAWSALFHRILEVGGEQLLDLRRLTTETDGHLRVLRRSRQSLGMLRDQIETMLRERNVRLLIIDEVMHLMRFKEYDAVLDTLKSLADAHHTKLLLIGTHSLTKLMLHSGQVARRSEILHYRRYKMNHATGKPATEDRAEFQSVLERLLSNWPARTVPNLLPNWELIMAECHGSVGLLKSMLLRLAKAQLEAPNEQLTAKHYERCIKSVNLNKKQLEEVEEGERELQGACYGESVLSDPATMKAFLARMAKPAVEEV